MLIIKQWHAIMAGTASWEKCWLDLVRYAGPGMIDPIDKQDSACFTNDWAHSRL